MSDDSHHPDDTDETNEDSLVVIGAGFGRTGTKSLKTALEIIYDKPCYHGFVLADNGRHEVQQWIDIDKEVENSKDGMIDPEMFKRILRGYRCTLDFPTCSYYKQLMEVYPKTKIILTMRDPKEWLQSARGTILPLSEEDWAVRLALDIKLRTRHFLHMFKVVWRRAVGPTVDMFDDEQVKEAFSQWCRQVEATVPPERLLIFRVRDGWEPLCAFLNVPKPNQPFPHVNDKSILVKIRVEANRRAIFIRWTVRALIAVSVALGVKVLLNCIQ